MCIAIGKPAGMAITEQILERCFDSNPDGAGFCVEVDGKLVVNKGYFTFKDFYTAYAPYENLKALIHFRIKTHGALDEDNCHPFFVNDNVAFIHNGIINSVPTHKNKSDTQMFNAQYLQPIVTNYGENALKDPTISELLGKFIGASKLVLMIKGEEEFVFVNKSLGNQSTEGIWFSNYSWQEQRVQVYQPESYKPKWQKNHKTFSQTVQEKTEISLLELHEKHFSFGTTVVATWPINHAKGTIPKGAVGEIVKVYSNKTVDVDFLLEGKIEGLYPYALEIIEDMSTNTWETSPIECLHPRFDEERYL